MSHVRWSPALSCLLLFALLSPVADAAVRSAPSPPGPLVQAQPSAALRERVARQIIVARQAGLSRAERLDVRRQAGVELVRALPLPGSEVVRVPEGQSLAAALRELNADPQVRYAERDGVVSIASLTDPNDPFFAAQWGEENAGWLSSNGRRFDADMDAFEAWGRTTGSGQTVAVIDTGVSAVADLNGRLATNPGESGSGKETNGIDDDGNGFVDDWRGWDFVGHDNNPTDEQGHGTHVAGIIAANADNGLNVAGLAPQAKVLPVRVMGADGSGSWSDVIAGVAYAGLRGAPVANLSLGAAGQLTSLRDAIAAKSNTLYVAAAGNNGTNNDTTAFTPCNENAANIICVGAMTEGDTRAIYSNYGHVSVDLFAPGDTIPSLAPDGSTVFMSGTSMATPQVAAAAALARSLNGALTTAELKALLMDATVRLPQYSSLSVSGGRLNAGAATALAQYGGALPQARTDTASVAGDNVTLQATVNAPAGSSWHFDFGESTAYEWQTTPQVLDTDGEQAVSVEMTNFDPATRYHARVVVEDGARRQEGADTDFNLGATLPRVSFGGVDTLFGGPLGWTVDPQGLDTNFNVQWGATTAYGNNVGPVSLAGYETPTRYIMDLPLDAPSTVHFRIVATNSAGTTTSPDCEVNRNGLPNGRYIECTVDANGPQRPIPYEVSDPPIDPPVDPDPPIEPPVNPNPPIEPPVNPNPEDPTGQSQLCLLTGLASKVRAGSTLRLRLSVSACSKVAAKAVTLKVSLPKGLSSGGKRTLTLTPGQLMASGNYAATLKVKVARSARGRKLVKVSATSSNAVTQRATERLRVVVRKR